MEDRFRLAGRTPALLGRADECVLLDELLAAVRRGEGRSLVLSGEAGIGKTALLGYLVESASGMTVLRAVGVESELELAYASLHQLCGALFDRLPTLPAPQRHALEVVFGLSSGSAPDRFLVGLGVLSLLSESAGERPLLCVVDDAQWLDRASASTLAFVARRLLAEPVGLVFASREPGQALEDIVRLELRGLRDADARALLGSALRFKLDERMRDRVIAETRGNPLALLELPRSLTPTQLAGGFALPPAATLSGRIEKSFVQRFEELPDETRRLLVLAAAEPTGDPLVFWRGAERLGIDPAGARSANSNGLLEIGQRVTFRHPLARSAVYTSAPAEERRVVHLALAEATDRETDPDRRAWHLANAASAPDEVVADELERSAGRARARGGVAAAAAFLERAVTLSDNPTQRAERALAGAEASLEAGAFNAAAGLLTAAEAGGSLDELQLARVELLRAHVALFSTLGSHALQLLVRAAQRLEPLDLRLARETYLDAWAAALFAGRLSGDGSLHEISSVVGASRQPIGAARASDRLLDSLAALVTEGRTSAAAKLHDAARGFVEDGASAEELLRWGWMAVIPTSVLWDEKTAYALCDLQLRTCREVGALAALPLVLNTFSGGVAVRCGEFASAEAAIAESDAVVEATGHGVAPYGAMVLAAYRGHEQQARTMIASARDQAAAVGQGHVLQATNWLLAVLCNGLGYHSEAMTSALAAMDDEPELYLSAWAAIELVEAATRGGEPHIARSALERVEAATSFTGTESGLGILARCGALLNSGEAADELYQEALERLGRSLLRPELARAHLLYGEWLYREQRQADAREQLHAAYDLFSSIGMQAFAERARTGLIGTGERIRKPTVETRDQLTEQERQIAQMAHDGLSNAEIGTRLFLSPRTVEWHLRKVYTKLEIRSRRELRKVLPISSSETLPA